MNEVFQCPAPDHRSLFRRRILALAAVQLIGLVTVLVAVAVLADAIIAERRARLSSSASRSNAAAPLPLDGRFVGAETKTSGSAGPRKTARGGPRGARKGSGPEITLASYQPAKPRRAPASTLDRLFAPGRFAYHGLVRRMARRYSVETRLVMAIMASESGGNPTAVSPQGAVGLMQLMPDTAAHLGVDPWDPEQNVEGAVRYLASLLSSFRSVDLSLVAYNAGPGFAAKYKNGEVELGAETRSFLIRVGQLLQ